ncbi:hypothetical protein EV714DRAFT_221854 [Schizophyllum commune]
MTTPGEQQFYSVALMDALMAELPRDWVVGLLYDIACQIHLSAVKHGLFGAYLDRLLCFAVAVFHAFGHDWPCQLIYHPRKCVGFGLTDGEGCERFWYSISKLIPYLRVAGVSTSPLLANGALLIAFSVPPAQVHLECAICLCHKRCHQGPGRLASSQGCTAGGKAQRGAHSTRRGWRCGGRRVLHPRPVARSSR